MWRNQDHVSMIKHLIKEIGCSKVEVIPREWNILAYEPAGLVRDNCLNN